MAFIQKLNACSLYYIIDTTYHDEGEFNVGL